MVGTVISVRALRKHYTVHKRPPGLRAAFTSLFRRVPTTVKAVDGISFEIASGERRGAGGWPRAPAARGRLPQENHARDGPEAAAALGLAPLGNIRPQPRH